MLSIVYTASIERIWIMEGLDNQHKIIEQTSVLSQYVCTDNVKN